MKKLKIAFISTFLIILIIPIALFNHKKNAVSEIDNKVLTENPLLPGAEPVEDLTDALENFVSERIGLRDHMILGYTLANDYLFGEMVHPTYTYGKDGYVFFKMGKVKKYDEFEDAFVHMLVEIQKYCDDRNIPFVFVFEPSKTSVLYDKLPEGYRYNNEWVQEFLNKLDENEVNYVDNSGLMRSCIENGIQVFNVKYNAGHWNDMGAFYGMNAVLENLKKKIPTVHINQMDEYQITQKLNTTLPVSEFPIHEYEPIFELKNQENIINMTEKYANEVERDHQYRHFAYFINTDREKEKAPRALVFQGSYINGMGYKFLQNGFGEYISVHDYQNILNFEYYVNMFKPDCVVFDAAEYTFSDTYFSSEGMTNFKLNPLYTTLENYDTKNMDSKVLEESSEKFTKIKAAAVDGCEYAYLLMNDDVFDMRKVLDENDEEYWEATVLKENLSKSDAQIIQVNMNDGVKYCEYVNAAGNFIK